MASTRSGFDRSTIAAFVVAVFIGGSNFVAVRFSNEDLDPLFGAAIRFGAAALVFAVMAVSMKAPWPRGRAAVGAAIYGFLGFGVAYALLYYALVGLTAGTSSLILASVPLLTLILAVAHRQEQFTTRGLIGGVLAIAGIALLSARSLGGDLRPIYVGAALLGAVAVAESSVAIKAFPRAHPVTTNALGMAVGTVFLTVASLALDERWVLPASARTWGVLAYLVLAGSVGLFALFLFIITRWTASASVYVLTLMPVVAVSLGALLADEPVTPDVIGGGVLVLSAVYVGALHQRPEEAPPDAPEPGVA